MPLTRHTVIYGGSFNPPHIGHQIACMWLTEALNAEEVILVPTYQHAFGKELLDFNHRFAMCKEIATLWSGRRVWVSNCEEHLPHPNYTINTVKHFSETRTNLAVAIGSDLVHELDKWTGWDEVMKLAKTVVIGRTGGGHADLDFAGLYQYPVELSAISSSQIRGQIRRGKDITGLVPHQVKRYIEKHGLYK